MFSVTIREKSGQVYTFHFDKPEIMIGRVKGNDVILPKQNISKRHSLVRVQSERFVIEDLGSTNGTYVNGHRIASPVEITSDDKVYLGDFVMQFFDLGEHLEASEPAAAPEPDIAPPPAPGEVFDDSFGASSERGQPVPYEADVNSVAGSQLLDGSSEKTSAELDSMAAVARLMAERKKQGSFVPADDDNVVAPDPLAALEKVDERMTGPMDGLSAAIPDRVASDMDSMQFEADDFLPEPFAPPPPAPEPEPIALGSSVAPPPAPAHQPEPFVAPPAPAPAVPVAPAAPVEPMPIDLDGDHQSVAAALYDQAIRILDGQLPTDASLLSDEQWTQMENRVVEFVDATLALSGGANGLDAGRLKRELIYEIVGVGPLEAMLDDASIEAIEVNGANPIFVIREGERAETESVFSGQAALTAAVNRMIRATGLRLPEGATVAEGALADGTSLRVALPPLCPNGPVVLLRKPTRAAHELEELVGRGMVTSAAAKKLVEAIEERRSVAVCGPASSGRRTVVNALGLRIADSERVAVAERGVRIQLPHSHVIRIDTGVSHNGNSPLAVARALRPDRLLFCADGSDDLGELVRVAGDGLPAWIGGFFARDADDLLSRAETALELRHPGLRPDIARRCVASAFDVIASFHVTDDGRAVLASVHSVYEHEGKLGAASELAANDSDLKPQTESPS